MKQISCHDSREHLVQEPLEEAVDAPLRTLDVGPGGAAFWEPGSVATASGDALEPVALSRARTADNTPTPGTGSRVASRWAHAAALASAAIAGLALGACNRAGRTEQSNAESTGAVAATPNTAATTASSADKNCCMGKNDCKGKGGCAVPESHSCAGQNECRGKGGCSMHCPKQ
jgi:hypothetical protein